MDELDKIIEKAIRGYDGSFNDSVNSFEELVSMGELVDRLTITNIKLFTLKDQVIIKQDQSQYLPESEKTAVNEFQSWASVEDVKLVRERARLKRCIDEKLIAMIGKMISGQKDAGFNAEVKKYGDQI